VPRLLRLSPRSAPYLEPAVAAQRPSMALEQAVMPDAEPVEPPAARALIRWARSRAALAHQHRDTLAALLAALSAPAPGVAAAVLRQRLARAQARLEAATGPAPAIPPLQPAAKAPPRAEASPHAPVADTLPNAAVPAVPPELPTAEDLPGLATQWGGALFWLTRVGAAWLALDPPPELAWLLHETALALGVPAHDPVLQAFCGGEAQRGEAPPDITGQAQALVDGWASWLMDAAPELPEPRIAAVCQRHGRLVMEPGWITLHLPLQSVDTAIRRLALDLDPGWLPWLGCVVRIRYDDA